MQERLARRCRYHRNRIPPRRRLRLPVVLSGGLGIKKESGSCCLAGELFRAIWRGKLTIGAASGAECPRLDNSGYSPNCHRTRIRNARRIHRPEEVTTGRLRYERARDRGPPSGAAAAAKSVLFNSA